MKLLKKLLALCVIAAMVLSITACGDGGDSKGGDPSSDNIMEKAAAAMESVKNYNLTMDMEMNMSAQGQTIETLTKAEGSCIADPLLMKLNMTMDMGQIGAMDMIMFAEKDGENYVTYMSEDNGTTWIKQITDSEEGSQIKQYDVRDSMDLYLESVENFKENGTETINGSEAVRYDGVISKDAIDEVMAATGADQQLESLGLSEDAADMYKDLGELPVSIWIDKETSLPVKCDMDMTEIMQSLMAKMMSAIAKNDSSAEDIELTVDKMFISMTMSDFNNVEPFEIPEAAKAAEAM